jgi:hypothetical protein
MTFKTVATRVGNATLGALTVIADAQTQTQINEIDAELEPMRQRVAELEERRADLRARLCR